MWRGHITFATALFGMGFYLVLLFYRTVLVHKLNVHFSPQQYLAAFSTDSLSFFLAPLTQVAQLHLSSLYFYELKISNKNVTIVVFYFHFLRIT